MTPGEGSQAAPAAAPVDAAALPSSYRINEYEIERPLGGGGFGITYLARDGNLNLPVAIKEYFPADLALRGTNHTVLVRTGQTEVREQYDWGLERFLDEARALATFRHPNIVRVLRYFRDNGTAYIVMEYESGLPLKRWVPQNSPLTQRGLMSIVRPLLDGLEQVHRSGFLHRDIKPDNIYVRADGSPVLLDFGSARRVQTNRELTNIVSPGFAPFEQYHSQGHQGPWTDIYSLGAVMYWMVTGQKPVESAARVRSDTLLPATSLGEVAVYGEPLLQAIDWAMQPEEGKRPQSVPEFRVALSGAEQAGGTGEHTRVLPDRRAMAAAGFAPSMPASGAGLSQRRNLLGTILFLDLVGYSIRSVDDQVAVKKLFNELINKALRGVAEDSRIAIDTGDGAAICFMGDPEEALHSALLLRDLLTQRYGTVLTARIGLHMGPVRVISDINDRVNVIGDGINVAQRVMDFAQPNQVLVSRAYYDVISRITDDTADLFQYLGQYADKHGRMHEVYSVETAQRGATQGEAPTRALTLNLDANTVPAAAALDDHDVHEVEADLARHIGPLAKVLVHKARPLALTVEQLRESLAPSIQEPLGRAQFLAGHPAHGPASRTQPPSTSAGLTRSGSGLSQPSAGHPHSGASQPRSGPSAARPGPQPAGVARQAPLSQPMTGVTRTAVSSRSAVELSADELAGLEQALGRYIGPMARIVLKKETARVGVLKDLLAALAAQIDQPAQRDEFMQAARKALPRRPL